MSILFLILKIIGILILIPIVLLLILLVFPICYQIEGDFDGKTPKAQAKVSWAVIFLRAKAFYEEELNFAIRIFGIPVYDSRKDHWSVLGEHPEKDKKKGKKKRKKKDKKKQYLNIFLGAGILGKKIVNLIKKCYNKCKNLITKISKITNKMETIGDIFEDEEIIDAVKRIKGYGISAVKLLLPQKLNVQITFGFEDPYHTGKALGWTAALIPIYGDHLDITPDFEKRTLKGHLKIKGSLRRYKILHLLWKVYKDKDELIKQKDRALRMIGGN